MPMPPAKHKLLTLLLGLLALGASACKCPGLFNKDCSLKVVVEVPNPATVNNGNAVSVSVVVVPSELEKDCREATCQAWFDGRIDLSRARRVDIVLREGRLEWSGPEAPKDVHIETKFSQDKRKVELRFRRLGNPDLEGFGSVAVFSSYPEQATKNPVFSDSKVVRGLGWDLEYRLLENKVDFVD